MTTSTLHCSLDHDLPASEACVADTRTLHILVKEVNPGSSTQEDDDIDDEDRDDNVAGLYSAEVPANLDDGLAAACAMGAFHSSFVVNWLEAFTFTVLDTKTWRELEPDQGVDWVQLGKACIDIECLGLPD